MEPDTTDLLAPVGGGGALIGYARVSTKGQNLDRQIAALEAAGCERIFSDKKSGKNTEREELWKAIGPGHYEAWEYGYISGKLATLRWVLGSEWDFLDT